MEETPNDSKTPETPQEPPKPPTPPAPEEAPTAATPAADSGTPASAPGAATPPPVHEPRVGQRIGPTRKISDGEYHRPIPKKRRTGLWIGIGAGVLVVLAAALYFFMRPDHEGEILIPYIAHQKPAVDPHLPSINALADKLDEVQFDGLFNLVAGPSGVMYEDGLGEFLNIDDNNVVTIRLKTAKRWHDSWVVTTKDEKFTIAKGTDHYFSPADLNFTLRRIQQLGSLSPDFILVSQALTGWSFEGPDAGNVIRLQFRGDRLWKESDIKEVLSFKILPDGSDLNALTYRVGTATYLALPPKDGVSSYYRSPEGGAIIPNVVLSPFIDNSTYTTELRNNNINVLLDTPFGSLSPILGDTARFFVKSNISNTFFALLFNTQRLTRDQRRELRRLVNNKQVLDRFYKVGTEQARHIVDYRGARDKYDDYLNWSVFPTSSYYVDDSVVVPLIDHQPANMSLLPDTVRIQVCLNAGYREELSELTTILNDPAVGKGRLKVTAVPNEELRRGNYDAVLVAFSGYRSNFLFDLYTIFLREPDLETYRIVLQTAPDGKGGLMADPASFSADHNFFRLDARSSTEATDVNLLLEYLYGFMSTRQIGDKQEYARRIDELEHSMCLGSWLFSMPSLAYFSTQFDASSIDLYGVASQLSTVKKWKERK